MEIKIPKGAEFIIKRLEECGHRADIVGGCVRDVLLGREPYDFDITTSAAPIEVMHIFRELRVIETGVAHGTVTLISDGVPYEVTTYRIDGEYKDARHPEAVSFTSRIEEDLRRRDFTVNAMAYSEKHGLTDLFSGKEDLEARVIRTVGDPNERFSEDALRILRALRFASVLSFSIEKKTASAIHRLKDKLEWVSSERIYAEWKKLLGGSGACQVIEEFSDVIEVFLPELSKIKIKNPERFSMLSADAKMPALFAIAANGDVKNEYQNAMMRLRSDKAARVNGRTVLEHIDADLRTDKELLWLLSKVGEERAKLILSVRYALGSAGACEINRLEELLAAGAVYTVSGLSIKGCDLLELGFSGEGVGTAFSLLLSAVMDGKIKNEREELINYAKAFLQTKSKGMKNGI